MKMPKVNSIKATIRFDDWTVVKIESRPGADPKEAIKRFLEIVEKGPTA